MSRKHSAFVGMDLLLKPADEALGKAGPQVNMCPPWLIGWLATPLLVEPEAIEACEIVNHFMWEAPSFAQAPERFCPAESRRSSDVAPEDRSVPENRSDSRQFEHRSRQTSRGPANIVQGELERPEIALRTGVRT